MIDLCIDARMALSSGIGTCIRNLVPYFNQPPFRIILLVDQIGRDWCQDIEQIQFSAPIYSIQEQILFPIKIPRCDLFWSPHYNVPILPIRAKKRVVTIHDACHLALSHLLSWPEKFYAKFMMHRAMHRSDIVITDSEFSKNELLRLLGEPQKKLSVIPAAVDHKRFKRVGDAMQQQLLRCKYNLPEKFILYVGNVKPHKNLSGLLEAFSGVSLSWGLVIIGKRKELRHSSKTFDQKKVLFLENVPDDDLPGLYSLAEVFVLPSFYEGFGLPPLEAMSCGCPTIVSNEGSLPEVCGDASLFVDPYDVNEIQHAIERLASDSQLRSQLIQQGFKRVKRFSWSDSAHLYKDCLGHLDSVASTS